MSSKPKRNTIIPPIRGWKPRTLYLVEVAYFANNPVHRALFYSGFLEDGKPDNYSGVMNYMASCFDVAQDKMLGQMYYVKVICQLAAEADLKTSDGRLPPKPTNPRKEELLKKIEELKALVAKEDESNPV